SMTSPMGRVLISFVPDNPYGVLDHTVTLPTGESTLNPMRVIALDAGRCEVVFTLRRGSMSDPEFEEAARAVAGDLAGLESIVEQAGDALGNTDADPDPRCRRLGADRCPRPRPRRPPGRADR